MTEKEIKYKNCILKVVKKEISQKEASFQLGITEREVRRIVHNYKDVGDDAFIHKNKNNKFAKKISTNMEKEIVKEYLNEYFDYNFTHFYEEHGIKYGISLSEMVMIFERNDIISPYAHHKTVKLYNNNMKKAIAEKTISEEEKKLYNERKLEQEERHFRRSNLHLSYGAEVQMDAVFDLWFDNNETALHLSLDKANNKILSGQFDYEETTDAYLIVLMDMIINNGIPKMIKTDKRNSFSINNTKSSKAKINITQFARICEDLEIDLQCSSNPLFKANIERENGTFKRRLKAELRHEGINNINDANKYLKEVFIPKMNKRFSYPINFSKSVMRKNDYSLDELNVIISIKYERTVDNASSIKFFNNYYLPINRETGEIESFKCGTKCTIIKAYDNNLFGIINEKLFSLSLIENKTLIKHNASNNGFRPNENNPWRKKFVVRY